MLLSVSRRICSRTGLDSFARRKEGDIILLYKEMSFDDVVVDRFLRYGETLAKVRRKVGYSEVRLPLLVAMRL